MKIILTGATGYVGEGTLLELLKCNAVGKVLSVSRKPTGIKHEKLEEYLVSDFMQLKEGDEHFKGYDAVFFIAGITSVGTPKDVYVRISQEIPLHFADIMPDKERMTFVYLSGAGTSPDGKQFWQQVKSKTEAEIHAKGFRRAFALRPAIMKWSKGQKHIQTMQYFFLPFYPVLRLLGQANNMRKLRSHNLPWSDMDMKSLQSVLKTYLRLLNCLRKAYSNQWKRFNISLLTIH